MQLRACGLVTGLVGPASLRMYKHSINEKRRFTLPALMKVFSVSVSSNVDFIGLRLRTG